MARTEISPDTLQILFEKALREGVELRQRPDGSIYARSASDGRTRYDVSEHGCGCPAGRRGQPCKHLALFLGRAAFHNWLTRHPQPPAVVTPLPQHPGRQAA